MALPNLKALFGARGAKLAEVYRVWFPKAILGSPAERTKALRILTQAADEASVDFKKISQEWLASDFLKTATLKGTKRAAADISATFGGANVSLINRMVYEASRNLIQAAESTRPFLARALRKGQAIATKQLDQGRAVLTEQGNAALEAQFNKSILQGTLSTEHGTQIAARIMDDLGLAKGDTIMLLNGQAWDAERYADLLAQTSKAEAENLAYADEIQSKGYQFILTDTHEGVRPGDICEFLQGKVWALTQNTFGIPVLPAEYGLPPWHPYCFHLFSVWIPELNGGQAAINKWADRHEKDADLLDKWRNDAGVPMTMQPASKND